LAWISATHDVIDERVEQGFSAELLRLQRPPGQPVRDGACVWKVPGEDGAREHDPVSGLAVRPANVGMTMRRDIGVERFLEREARDLGPAKARSALTDGLPINGLVAIFPREGALASVFA
jgi:hypothetical protein